MVVEDTEESLVASNSLEASRLIFQAISLLPNGVLADSTQSGLPCIVLALLL